MAQGPGGASHDGDACPQPSWLIASRLHALPTPPWQLSLAPLLLLMPQVSPDTYLCTEPFMDKIKEAFEVGGLCEGGGVAWVAKWLARWVGQGG